MVLRWSLIGAPSSAGARTPGVDRAPGALRAGGLLAAFDDRGISVHDLGDLPDFRWRPDPSRPNAQNAGAVLRMASDLAGVVATAPGMPLVLGGDSTATWGLVAGTGSPALVYIDGTPGLHTPETRPVGNLSSMVLAHLLGLPGCDLTLAAFASVPPRRVVLYGEDLPVDDPQLRVADRLRLSRISANEVHAGPAKSAARARFAVEDAAEHFVVHVAADVLAFARAPYADEPQPGGLSLQELTGTLAVLTASPQFTGLALTNVNPDHVPDEPGLAPLIEALTAGLA
ncbi:arginase family protein [Winogradskya consettensis]|uniref:arginase family protein n=1 Tax=Winogradskya consettensis TaxID=113560 RepID=UPI001BB2F5C3|nr:arginase family protein [Actinoplanes consettensis]